MGGGFTLVSRTQSISQGLSSSVGFGGCHLTSAEVKETRDLEEQTKKGEERLLEGTTGREDRRCTRNYLDPLGRKVLEADIQ